MVELFDFYANTIPLTLGAFLQTIFVCWVYKIENLQEKLTEQTGEFFPLYVRICVKYIAPIFLLIILIFSFISAVGCILIISFRILCAFLPGLSRLVSCCSSFLYLSCSWVSSFLNFIV